MLRKSRMIEHILNQIILDPIVEGIVKYLQSIGSILQSIVPIIVVAITLYFTARTFFRMRNTEQVKISHDLFKLYLELEKESAELREEGKELKERKDWASRYFNTLEWFSLLVNSKEITNDRLLGFYKPLIISSCEEILPKHFSESERKEDNFFPELQELYENLKNGKIKVYHHNKSIHKKKNS